MTRINTTMSTGLFTHDMLLDQHLFIAYREITRISAAARLLLPSEEVPAYVMGTGHMKFFYDKGEFLARQCEELYQACVARGKWPNITHKVYKPHPEYVCPVSGPVSLNNDWQPDRQAHLVNLIRLHEKLQDKPSFYTLNGKPVAKDYYMQIINKVVEYYK